MRFNWNRIIAQFIFLAFLLLMALLFVRCGGIKKTKEKKLEKVNELYQKETVKENNLQLNKDVEQISKSNTFNIKPVNPNIPTKFTFKNDTLTTINGGVTLVTLNKNVKIKENKKEDSKQTENVNLQKNNTIKTETQEKSKSGFKLGFWGWFWIFILVLLVIAYFYLRNKIPFLP